MSPRSLTDSEYEKLSARVRNGGTSANPKNAYAQGKRLEYRVSHALREAGFITLRSAGSKGAVDIMAVREGELLFVQVKRTIAPGPAPWNLLYDMAQWCSGVPLLATCEPYRPIRWERLVCRKPIPRKSQAMVMGIEPTGLVLYVVAPTAVLEEPAAAEDDESTEGEPLW